MRNSVLSLRKNIFENIERAMDDETITINPHGLGVQIPIYIAKNGNKKNNFRRFWVKQRLL